MVTTALAKMSDAKGPTIDLTERFAHLPGAPIVEAVIDLRAKAAGQWEEATVRASLQPHLGDYVFLDSQQEFQHQVKMEVGKPPQQEVRHLGWTGLRYRSSDGKNVVQFNRDGFVFRRLSPYENWDRFRIEAMRLWDMYLALAKPAQMQRIGLRFINRIELSPPAWRVEEYLSGGPITPEGLGDLPFHNFMHHDTWAVPNYPYAINVIRVFQALPSQSPAVILDIDAFTITAFEFRPEVMERQLAELRWLKNKTFFGIVTPKLLAKLKEPK